MKQGRGGMKSGGRHDIATELLHCDHKMHVDRSSSEEQSCNSSSKNHDEEKATTAATTTTQTTN